MEAGQLIADAHSLGLIVVLWIYPRGKAVPDEKDAHLIAGAAGLAVSIGTDFVKVNPPKGTAEASSAELLKEASLAAGRTGLVCAGGSTVDAKTFLTQLWEQIHVGGATGNATGRNIHQRPLDEAVRLTKAISAITLSDYSADDALKIFEGTEEYSL
jgi:DhnA family fructose-bisphosphate aldolase class Ia